MSRVVSMRSAFVIALLALMGCGGSGRYEVSGTVTLKGKPLESGQIRFDPIPGGTASAAATITNGKYVVPAAMGLLPGKYKVFITSIGGAPEAKNVVPGSEPVTEPKDLIPERYNQKSTLTCDVIAGKNTHDFPLD